MEMNTVHAQRMIELKNYTGQIEGMGVKMLFIDFRPKAFVFYITKEDGTDIAVPINKGFEIGNVIRYLNGLNTNTDIEFFDYIQFSGCVQEVFQKIKMTF